jgi:hypothetical protein
MTGLVTFDAMRLVSGGLGRGVLDEMDRIWGGQHFAEEKQCHLDAAAILSRARNGAIAFFKVGRSIWVDSVESLSLLRLDLLWPISRGRKDLSQCCGLKCRSSVDVHWKYDFPASEGETHGNLSQFKPLPLFLCYFKIRNVLGGKSAARFPPLFWS